MQNWLCTRRARLLGPAIAMAAVLALALAAPAPGAWKPGIDVSRFQGKIGWEAVGGTPMRFVFAQASRGDGSDCTVVPGRCGTDKYYARNYRGARAVGLRVGAYHRAFVGGGDRAGAREDARAEANLFVSMVGHLRRRDLLPALDVESPFGGLGPNRLRLWIHTWLRRVEHRLGAKPIIYTNQSSWNATGNTTEFALAGHPLWVASWNTDAPLTPAADWAGQSWSIWQHTSSARVKGIRGKVDRNRLRVPMRRVSARSGR